jgi:hypothetical protein
MHHGKDDAVAAGCVELERVGCHGANARGHGAAEHRASAMEAGLHGFQAEAQRFARFRCAHAFDVPQHEHEAIRLGQLVDRTFDDALQLARIRLMLGAGQRTRHGLRCAFDAARVSDENDPAAAPDVRDVRRR